MAGGRKGNGKDGGIAPWMIIVGFIVIANISWLWWVFPLGIVALILKFAKDGASQSTRNNASAAKQATRMEKYLIMTEGREAESIEYLASAVGVSYDTALRDLQKMVSEGRFGNDAYINYVDRSVVIPRPGARPSSASAPKNRPSVGAEGSNMVSRAAESDAKKKAASGVSSGKKTAAQSNAKSGAKASAKSANAPDTPYGKLRKILLIAGIVLLLFGVVQAAEPLDWLLSLGFDMYTLRELIPGLAALAAGGGCLGYRGFLKKRENRFKLYEAACAQMDYVPIRELASKAGVSERKCKRDLEAMMEKGLLPATAYIDQGEGALVLTPGAAPKAKAEPVTKPEEDNEDRYKAILREIRKLNDDIPDEEVSRRIDEMEDLTGKIFKAVQEKPEKEPQIKSFMSYYLPTTLKLLHSYADFGASGAQGENIKSAKAEIERILDTLVDGFRKQLDKLYETEAMDISSDIDVLETMLRRDGLTGDGSAFNVKTK